MKLFSITKSLSSLTLCVAVGITSQPAVADHEDTYQSPAANGCFPRVFSQIDQFKMSSGGLRNTHPNPRSIVCSIPQQDTDSSTETLTYIGINFETLTESMDCTAYTRSGIGDGLLLDSVTVSFIPGTTGQNTIGSLSWAGTLHNADQVYNYIQCKVPGDGRIFSIEAEGGANPP